MVRCSLALVVAAAAQQSVEDAAAALEGASAVPAQARVPLAGVCASVMTPQSRPHQTVRLAHQNRASVAGTYDLLYSAAKGGSNGKIGPFVGQASREGR